MIKKIQAMAESALRENEPRAIQALNWYSYASQFCAELEDDFTLGKNVAAGIIAALSPLQRWDNQVKDTPGIIHELQAGKYPSGIGFFSNKDKAVKIFQGEDPLEVLGGDKVRNFYRNLIGDEQAVCIDRHAISISGFSSKSADAGSLTSGVYSRIAFAFKCAAQNLGLSPSGIQALTWCYFREIKSQRNW